MLNLNTVLSKSEEIQNILAKHDVQEYKLFGQIISQYFPLSADANFLITPGQHTDSRHWNALQEEIRELFPLKNVRFYTLNILNRMVKLETLKQEHVKDVEKNAVDLGSLKNKAVLNTNNNGFSNKGGKAFFQEISGEEERFNKAKEITQHLSRDYKRKLCEFLESTFNDENDESNKENQEVSKYTRVF